MPTGTAAQQAAIKRTTTDGKGQQDLEAGSLSGNLTRDPELRYTESGRAVVNLGVAFSERVKDKATGEWKDGETSFYEVQCWGNLAENCGNFLRKGDRIVAEGRWTSLTWKDKEGNIQERIVLTARDLGPSMMFRGATPEPKQKGGQQ